MSKPNYATDGAFIAWLSKKVGMDLTKYGLPRLSGLSIWHGQSKVYARIPGDFLALIYVLYRQNILLRSAARAVPKPDKVKRGGR